MCRQGMCSQEGVWPATSYDTTVYHLCPQDAIGLMFRTCNEVDYHGVWSEVDSNNCCMDSFLLG